MLLRQLGTVRKADLHAARLDHVQAGAEESHRTLSIEAVLDPLAEC